MQFQKQLNFTTNIQQTTLIVVTGDHETGGMTLGFAGTKYSTAFSVLGNQKVSNDKFTKLLNEKLPEAKKLSDLAGLVKDSFGLDMDTQSKSKLALTETELADLEKAFQESKKINLNAIKVPKTTFYMGNTTL